MPTKVSLVKAMAFPVVMCGCESWTIKKAEGTRVNLWRIHVDVWQNQYNIVKLKNI